VKKLLQRDANVGGHGGFLLPCCCCSNTHGTRSWPLASREQPPSGIYTTTWDSSSRLPTAILIRCWITSPTTFAGRWLGPGRSWGRRHSQLHYGRCQDRRSRNSFSSTSLPMET